MHQHIITLDRTDYYHYVILFYTSVADVLWQQQYDCIIQYLDFIGKYKQSNFVKQFVYTKFLQYDIYILFREDGYILHAVIYYLYIQYMRVSCVIAAEEKGVFCHRIV